MDQILRQSCTYELNYLNSAQTTITGLTQPPDAKTLYIQIFFDGHLMCYEGIQLAVAAML